MFDLQRKHRALPEQEEQRRRSRADAGVERRQRLPEVCATELQNCQEAGNESQGSDASAFRKIRKFDCRGETKSLRTNKSLFFNSTENLKLRLFLRKLPTSVIHKF